MSATGTALTALLDNLSEGVCLIAADGRVSAANRRFSELLDLPADTLRKGERAASLANLPARLHG